MTKQEFDEAMERLRRDGRKAVERLQREGRVFIVVGLVMRNRLGLPDNEPWGGPTDAELAEFLASANHRQLKLLKEIAEGLETETISEDEYLAETGQDTALFTEARQAARLLAASPSTPGRGTWGLPPKLQRCLLEKPHALSYGGLARASFLNKVLAEGGQN